MANNSRRSYTTVPLVNDDDALVNPPLRWYRDRETLMLGLALFSSLITPLQFAFLEKLPISLIILDVAHTLFLVDVAIQIQTAYYDTNRQIWRYITSCFPHILACIPWVSFYYVFGPEGFRWLVLLRIFRLWKVFGFFSKMEENSWLPFLTSQSMKMLALNIILAHVGACVYFYIAMHIPTEIEGNTWIGTLQMGMQSYSDFKNMPFGKLYTLSVYFAFMTLTTIGFGDIHSVNETEMIFTMIFVLSQFLICAYVAYEKKEPDSALSGQHVDDMLTEALIQRDVNAVNSLGKTELHLAASEGNLEVAKSLIERGYEVDALDDLGYTPLFDAMKGRHDEMVDFLKENGAQLTTGDEGSFLCEAVATNDVDYIRWLLAKGMNRDARDKDMNTPSNVALQKGFIAIVELLTDRVVAQETDRQRDDPEIQVNAGD